MKIEQVIWLRDIVDKLASKHGVETREVEEVLGNRPKIRFVEKGLRRGEDLYVASGQTVVVMFIYKKTRDALILSARDMAPKEKRLYGKK